MEMGHDIFELVFFGEELCLRAPKVAGCIYCRAGDRWLNVYDLAEAIRAKVPFFVRPATDEEMKRLEKLVVWDENGRVGSPPVRDLIPGGPAYVMAEKTIVNEAGSFAFPLTEATGRTLQ